MSLRRVNDASRICAHLQEQKESDVSRNNKERQVLAGVLSHGFQWSREGNRDGETGARCAHHVGLCTLHRCLFRLAVIRVPGVASRLPPLDLRDCSPSLRQP
jgi:hypothetical protein